MPLSRQIPACLRRAMDSISVVLGVILLLLGFAVIAVYESVAASAFLLAFGLGLVVNGLRRSRQFWTPTVDR